MRKLLVAVTVVVLLVVLGGSASGAPARTHTAKADTITLDTLPIANALPMDLGIQKGFFAKQNIEIKKQILQSGNDIVLALANHNGDIGYIGYVPAMIARSFCLAFMRFLRRRDPSLARAGQRKRCQPRRSLAACNHGCAAAICRSHCTISSACASSLAKISVFGTSLRPGKISVKSRSRYTSSTVRI